MAYIGKVPTAVPLTSSDITDGIVTTAKIADDAVDNTKLDLTSNYAFTGTISGAGGLIKLHTQTISANTASVSFNGYFSSSYTNYYIIGSSLVNDANASYYMRYRQSNADVTGSNYIWTQNTIRCQDSTGGMEEDNNAGKEAFFKLSSTNTVTNDHDGNASKRAFNFNISLHDPLGTSNMKYYYGSSHHIYDNTNDVWYYNHHIAGTYIASASALSGFTIYPSSGNIDSGTITLYGVTK